MMLTSDIKIKWIVSDMDGTMLDPDRNITALTKRALMESQNKGIVLILASGRSYRRLQRYADELDMASHGGYFIEVNGMAIKELATGKRVVFQRMEKKDIIELYRFIKDMDMEFQGYQDGAIYNYIPMTLREDKKIYRDEQGLPEDYPWTSGDWQMVLDLRDGYPDTYMVETENDLPDQLNKVGAFHHPEVLDRIGKEVKCRFGDRFEVTRTTPRCIEFTPKGISKGNALRKMMEEHQVLPEEVLVFGDGENDLSMFEVVKHSVAMGNAPEAIRKAASDVTLGNQEDGIAYTLKKLGIID